MEQRSIGLPVYSVAFWNAYVVQMRPYLLFVSGAAGSLGVALAADNTTAVWKIVAAFIPFFFGYGFGQALTDCFQTDTDKLSAPYRPLSRGIITIPSAMITSLAGLSFCAVVLFLLDPTTLWLCLMSVFGLATYSYVKKHLWFAGPFYNAWIVALLPVMGYLAVSGDIDVSLIRLPDYVAITFFSYANFVLIGYLKDIEPDRATGYKTFPVVFGWEKTVIAGDVLAFITILLFWRAELAGIVSWVCGMAATVIIVSGLVQAHLTDQRNEVGAMIPILCTVRSFVLFHLALVLSAQPDWLTTAVVFYILFEVALHLRPVRYQV